MAGEGAHARVVRLNDEQKRAAYDKKKRGLLQRADRIERQAREQLEQKLADAQALRDEAATPYEAKLLEDRAASLVQTAHVGAIGKLRRYVNNLKENVRWIVMRAFMRRLGIASLLFAGAVSATCYDADGAIKWVERCSFNKITTEGRNHILDVTFHNDTQVSTWYIGLVSGASTPTYADADTLASHAGWTEYTAYSETNRQVWQEGAASAGAITNSTTSDFSMNASGTVAGLLLCSVASGTSGTLWTAVSFSGGNQSVSDGDTLKVTYALSTASS